MNDFWNRLLDRYLLSFTVAVLVGLFVFLMFADRMIVNVPAGYRGVLWDRFGGRTRIYGEGMHIILPWNVLTHYEVRWQTIDRRYHAIDATGLSIEVEMSTLIQANIGDDQGRCNFGTDRPELKDEPCLGRLHKAFGPDYIERLVIPQIGSQIRTVIADKEAVAVYGPRRPEAEREIYDRIQRQIAVYQFDLVRVATVFVREIVLPQAVSKAIDDKAILQHQVERESTEAERKKVEADGIKVFTDTVSGSLTTEYLRLKGIEATLKLAESTNAKIVVFGSGPLGLPIVFGNEGVPGRPVAAATEPGGQDTRSAAPAAPPADGKPAAAAAPPPNPPPTGVRALLNSLLGRGQ